eukprot:887921-Pleurochrysis_carterae.AAC.1
MTATAAAAIIAIAVAAAVPTAFAFATEDATHTATTAAPTIIAAMRLSFVWPSAQVPSPQLARSVHALPCLVPLWKGRSSVSRPFSLSLSLPRDRLWLADNLVFWLVQQDLHRVSASVNDRSDSWVGPQYTNPGERAEGDAWRKRQDA